MKNRISQSESNKLKIGITLGDPAGIGPEVIMKSLDVFKIPTGVRILLIGDAFLISFLNQKLDVPVYLNVNDWERDDTNLGMLNIQVLDSHQPIKYGQAIPEYGKAAYRYLVKASELIKSGILNRLVTGPVNKKVINLAGIEFIGHTEFLTQYFYVDKVAMMLLSDNLKLVLLTRHVPLKEVPNEITEQKLISVINIVDSQMRKIFKLDNVRIGIAGLNPHLGDDGLIGIEEKEVIIPTVRKIKQDYDIKGPLSIHELIQDVRDKMIDVIICMYHDQGLVPLKLTYPNKGVNLTLGLPFIRTSPVHGTAYDIAGKNKASPDSMLETLKFTVSI